MRPVGFPQVKVTARAADEGGTGRVLPGAGGPAMSIKPFSDGTTIPFGIGVLATLVVVVGWLVFQGDAPFVLGCLVMLALTGSEVALVLRPIER